MGGCRCSYKTCQNTPKTTENIHFFHYPVRQRDRCRSWIINADKPQYFDLDEFQLRNRVICEVHFKDECFLNSQKKKLLPNAIPTKDGDSCLPIGNSASGICTIRSKDNFKQFSTKLDDVQILPANDDGTLFVLDTFPSYNVSNSVKSYVINNDALLPISQKNDIMNRVKIEQDVVDSNDRYIHIEGGQKNMVVKESTIINNSYDKIKYIGKSGIDSSCLSSNSQTNISNDILQDMICKTVESKYLHKLNQHSKDLQQIKKALRSSRTCKINKAAVLRFLKLRLPPTLYTLVNLTIDDDYELTEEDESFFKNLHDCSSRTYDFLMGDCNWHMPMIEIHEGDPNEMDDT